MNNLYVWCMTIGGSLMPIAAGYITINQGWRWLWWWIAIMLGVLLLLFTFLYEETKYMPTLSGMSSVVESADISERTKSVDHKPFDLQPIDSIVTTVPPPRKTYLQRLKPWTSSDGSIVALLHHTYQPFFVMGTIPAVLYVALLYGLITAAFQVSVTLISTTLPAPPYSFNAAQVGLMNIPALVGNTLGALVSSPFSDRIILWLARKNNGVYEPEMRLWLLLAFAPFFPAGRFVNIKQDQEIILKDYCRINGVRLRSWWRNGLANSCCRHGHVLVRHAPNVQRGFDVSHRCVH
jgi:MFS family permease